MNVNRLLDLQEKAAADALTEAEAAELDSMTVSEDGKATGAQLDYIEMLLGLLEADLGYYTNISMEELTLEEAIEVIDELKGDLGYD